MGRKAQKLSRPEILRKHTDIGGLVAERESQLSNVYVHNDYLDRAIDHNDGRCFLIGRTGSGKSAILRMVEEKQPPEDVLVLKANQFTFKEIELRTTLVQLHRMGGSLDYIFKTVWKYLIVVTLIKRRFPDLDERLNVLKRMRMQKSNKNKAKAYLFLEKNEELYGDKTFQERLSGMLDKLETDLSAQLKLSDLEVGMIGLKLGEVSTSFGATRSPDTSESSSTTNSAPPVRTPSNPEMVSRDIANVLVKSWELPMLRDVIDLLRTELLSARKYWILIDDLDKSFAGAELSSDFIRCLFDVIMELSHIDELKFLVALRTNIFHRLDFYQSEKVEDYCTFIEWSPTELKTIVEERIRRAFNDPTKLVYDEGGLFSRSVTDGNKNLETFEYMQSRTLSRPRDILSFLKCALEKSVGSTNITADSLTKSERRYSQGRMKALKDEWTEEYPAIDLLLKPFSSKHPFFSYDQLCDVLDNVFLAILEEHEANSHHVVSFYVNKWGLSDERLGTRGNEYDELVRVFWTIGVVGIRPSSGGELEFWSTSAVTPEFCRSELCKCKFQLHPMLYRALNIWPGASP